MNTFMLAEARAQLTHLWRWSKLAKTSLRPGADKPFASLSVVPSSVPQRRNTTRKLLEQS